MDINISFNMPVADQDGVKIATTTRKGNSTKASAMKASVTKASVTTKCQSMLKPAANETTFTLSTPTSIHEPQRRAHYTTHTTTRQSTSTITLSSTETIILPTGNIEPSNNATAYGNISYSSTTTNSYHIISSARFNGTMHKPTITSSSGWNGTGHTMNPSPGTLPHVSPANQLLFPVFSIWIVLFMTCRAVFV